VLPMSFTMSWLVDIMNNTVVKIITKMSVGTSYVRIAITLCYAYVLSILFLDISLLQSVHDAGSHKHVGCP